MKIISFIERDQETVIEKILRHCSLWMVAERSRSKETPQRAPPEPVPSDTVEEPALDYEFFDRVCI